MTAIAHTKAHGAGRFRVPDAILPWAGALGFILVVELVTRADIIPQKYFPPPTVMFVTLAEQFTVPAFWAAVGNTIASWAVSVAIAAALAIPIGTAMGASRTIYASLLVLVEFLRPIPSVALIPAVILVIGVNVESKVFLAAFATFWPILIQTVYGVRDVEPVAVDTARSFGCGWLRRLAFIVLPSALPYISTGIRIGSAVALIIVVTMEIVVGVSGIGQLILMARQGANVEVAYALILAAGLIGWALNTLIAQVEQRLLFWHPSHRKAGR